MTARLRHRRPAIDDDMRTVNSGGLVADLFRNGIGTTGLGEVVKGVE